MRLPRMHAGRKGVKPPDTVGKPLFDEKFERPVGDGRLVAETVFGQPVEHLVGAERAVTFQQDFKRAPPHGRQPHPAFGGQRVGTHQHVVHAMCVIMRGEGGDIVHVMLFHLP